MVDEYTRECPVIPVDTSLPAARVIGVLEPGHWQGRPRAGGSVLSRRVIICESGAHDGSLHTVIGNASDSSASEVFLGAA